MESVGAINIQPARRQLPLERSLLIRNPEVANEWHPFKNGAIKPFDVFPFTNKKYWWHCTICSHEWRTTPGNRVKGTSCPNCKAAHQTSYPELALVYYLRNVFPDVVFNYHLPQTDNGVVDIFLPEINLVIEYDGIFYHRKRLEQDEEKSKLILALGMNLLRLRAHGLPDLDIPGIKILKHYDQNDVTLTKCIIDVFTFIHSHICGNFELDSIMKSLDLKRDGVNIRGILPPMIKKRNAQYADYDFLNEWHVEYNAPFRPEHVASKSNTDYWWKCRRNEQHVWQASMGTRSKGHGCPYCAGQKVDDQNSLAVKNPELAAEWCQKLNGDITPFMILPQSNKPFWWTCPNCNSDYPTKPNYRIQGEGCPYCSGKRVNHTNSLAVKYPSIAAEWHLSRNGTLTPHMVSSGSSKKVWWLCSKGHEWDAVIYSRKQKGCRHCYWESRNRNKRQM